MTPQLGAGAGLHHTRRVGNDEPFNTSGRDPAPSPAPSTERRWTSSVRWLATESLSPRKARLLRLVANLIGATGAGFFAWATLDHYLQTHSWVGAAFFAEQMWVVIAYLIRRPARCASRRLDDWALAFGGTFAGVLFRPDGAHTHWGVQAGLVVQLVGLSFCVLSFLTLGRSFGFVAADRGLVRSGPYGVVRHPIYASYVLLQAGYVLQSLSVANVLVMLVASGCNVGRARAEDRVLATNDSYTAYRDRVRWRMLPGVW